MRPLGKFLIHAYVIFAFFKKANFKTSLPVTFTSIACWQVQADGIGTETFRWAGWWDEAKTVAVAGSEIDKAYILDPLKRGTRLDLMQKQKKQLYGKW